MTLAGIASGARHIEAGTLKALAVGRPTRFEALPQVPTLDEAGYPYIDPLTWFGAFAPAGTLPELLARLHAAIATAMQAPSVRDRHLVTSGYTVHMRTPEATAAFLREDLDYKRQLIATAGIRAD
jgi:tripartite-type tricarboxylate transporter receptor subunit TctC